MKPKIIKHIIVGILATEIDQPLKGGILSSAASEVIEFVARLTYKEFGDIKKHYKHMIRVTEKIWAINIRKEGYDVKYLKNGNTPYQEYPCIEYKIDEQTTLWHPCNGELIGTVKKNSCNLDWDILLNDDVILESYWLEQKHTILTFLTEHGIKDFEQLILLKKI